MGTIQFQFTKKELYKIATTQLFNKTVAIFYVLFIICIVIAFIFHAYTAGWLLILICIFYPFFQIWGTYQSIKKHPEVLSNVTYEFSDDGTKTITELGSSELKWKNYSYSKESNDYFHLFIDNYPAEIIPKRAFNEQQLEDFRALLQKNILANK